MFDQEIMFIKCPFCHEHRIVNKSKKNLNLKIEGAQEE